MDYYTFWNPILYIENLLRQEKETKKIIPFVDPSTGHCILTERRQISGIFAENLELHHFPFDTQASIAINQEI